jgi:hypothetical protein
LAPKLESIEGSFRVSKEAAKHAVSKEEVVKHAAEVDRGANGLC